MEYDYLKIKSKAKELEENYIMLQWIKSLDDVPKKVLKNL